MSSTEELRQDTIEFYHELCETVFTEDELGVDGSIAILDSVFDPGDSFRRYNRVGRQTKPSSVSTQELENNPGSQATTGHGIAVWSVLRNFYPDPICHFFLTVARRDGEFDDRHMLHALWQVLKYSDEIDIVNISAGLDHISDPKKDCDVYGPSCSVCDLAQEVVDEGTVIVAGAGNRPHTENICCPSLERDVISVGGAIAKCTAEMDPTGVYDIGESPNPPNALYIQRSDDEGAQGVYCSNRGCYPGTSCSENRELRPWPGNPTTETDKPDILAPLILPMEDNTGPKLAAGTSYATPIVTGEVGTILRMLKAKGVEPLPAEVRASVKNTGTDVSGSPIKLFNSYNLLDVLTSRYDLPVSRNDSNDFYDLH